MVWADGRREVTDVGGGRCIITMVRCADGRHEEVTFTLVGLSRSDEMVYEETSRRDTTREMAEARRRIEDRRWEVIRRGIEGRSRDTGSWIARLRRRLAAWLEPR